MIASAISQLWAAQFACAILHPQTWNVHGSCIPRNFIRWAPNIQPDEDPLASWVSMETTASGREREIATTELNPHGMLRWL